ncbi:hypothetical protein EDB19DRAFT_1914631 [Suillus lakei]|nr:hypothetical protein EDB19DRAFT_1914631 [Suillus lakei]
MTNDIDGLKAMYRSQGSDQGFHVVLTMAQRCPPDQAMFCPHTMVLEYAHIHNEEFEQDNIEYYNNEDGVEDSNDALPADDGEDEEWEDCEEGEDHEETNYYDEL